MSNAIYKVPETKNEPVLSYAPGSAERSAVKAALKKMRASKIDIPMIIGGEEVKTKKKEKLSPPHDHKHTIGTYSKGTKVQVNKAIKASLDAKEKWAATPWQDRAAIFLKAADLIAGPYRAETVSYTHLTLPTTPYV